MTRGTVVKVGGSLYDDPNLGPKLRAFLATLAGPRFVVPGGGAFADAVRNLDRVHGLGEAAAHWVALESLHAPAAFLAHLVGDLADVLDVPAAVARFEERYGPVPAAWDVTTDSLAAYIAADLGCDLVLLKSTAIPAGVSWAEAAGRGWVDAHFPAVVARFGLAGRAVDVREWPGERGA